MGKPGTAVPGGRAGNSRVLFWGRHSRSRAVVTSDPDSCGEISSLKKYCLGFFDILRASDGITEVPVLAAGGTSNRSHLLIVAPSDMPVARAVQVLKNEVLALAR
jgi:hypothetical protein